MKVQGWDLSPRLHLKFSLEHCLLLELSPDLGDLFKLRPNFDLTVQFLGPKLTREHLLRRGTLEPLELDLPGQQRLLVLEDLGFTLSFKFIGVAEEYIHCLLSLAYLLERQLFPDLRPVIQEFDLT